MDDADIASDKSQALNDELIANVRRQAIAARLPHNGKCYYCAEDVVAPKAFCDTDCRDDYDREKRLLSLRGRS